MAGLYVADFLILAFCSPDVDALNGVKYDPINPAYVDMNFALSEWAPIKDLDDIPALEQCVQPLAELWLGGCPFSLCFYFYKNPEGKVNVRANDFFTDREEPAKRFLSVGLPQLDNVSKKFSATRHAFMGWGVLGCGAGMRYKLCSRQRSWCVQASIFMPYFVHKCTIERGPVCTYKEVFA